MFFQVRSLLFHRRYCRRRCGRMRTLPLSKFEEAGMRVLIGLQLKPESDSRYCIGISYNQDKVKVSSGPSLFNLIGIDLFEVPEATHNIAAHPNNRVYLANQRYNALLLVAMLAQTRGYRSSPIGERNLGYLSSISWCPAHRSFPLWRTFSR